MDNISEQVDTVLSDEMLMQQKKEHTVEEMVAYLKSHGIEEGFIQKHEKFIKEDLKFSEGKIDIEGWLLLINFGFVIGAFICLYNIFTGFGVGNIAVVIYNVIFSAFYAILVYFTILRDKRYLLLVKINMFINLFVALILFVISLNSGFNLAVFTQSLVAAIWLRYTFVSKRLKLTYVNSTKPV